MLRIGHLGTPLVAGHVCGSRDLAFGRSPDDAGSSARCRDLEVLFVVRDDPNMQARLFV
jgi:hypothetical protein